MDDVCFDGQFEFEQAGTGSWVLTIGDPPYTTETVHVFRTRAELDAWIEANLPRVPCDETEVEHGDE